MMEGDVEEGSTPLKDLFDHLSQGQSKITFAQFKVLYPCCFCLPWQSMHHLGGWRAQRCICALNACLLAHASWPQSMSGYCQTLHLFLRSSAMHAAFEHMLQHLSELNEPKDSAAWCATKGRRQ